MLVQYAVNYLQTKIREIEPHLPSSESTRRSSVPDAQYFDNFVFLEGDSSRESSPPSSEDARKQKHLGYLREAIKRLNTLPSDALLSEILLILHGHRKTDEELNSSRYYNEVIKPLEAQLIIEQERLVKVEQEHLSTIESQFVTQVDPSPLAQVKDKPLTNMEEELIAQIEPDSIGPITEQNHELSPDYHSELKKIRPNLNPEVATKLDTLLLNVVKLNENDIAVKNRIFETTYQLLTEKMPVEEYRDFARTVQGKPSTLLKLIGSIMLSIAAVFVALALTFTTEGLSLSVVVPAATLAAPGMYSLFAGRQKGISSDMEELSNTYSSQL